jgi:UDP-glucose 4-epimerase
LAANSSVPYSVLNPLEDAEVNYIGSIKTVALAKKYNVERFLAASTAALYAHPRYLPVKETHPPNCLSPYAITKQSMEYYMVLSGIEYTILRFSNVYGPGQNKKGEAGVISIFIDAMLAGEDVKIYGDGEQIRDFIYVEDVVKAIYSAMFSEKCKNQIMNISSNTPTTINELFHKIRYITNYQKQPIYLEERAGDIKASILDNSLAKELFDFSPQVDIKTGLELSIKALNN